MTHEMRRKRQLLSQQDCTDVLKRGTSGVLALLDADGFPYAVPLSYAYSSTSAKIYFHCAREGHKLDAVRHCSNASFCVIDQDHVVPSEYTTYFRSVIAFGTIRILEDSRAKRAAILRLADRYSPDETPERRDTLIDREFDALCILELSVERLTGKQAIELVRQQDL